MRFNEEKLRRLIFRADQLHAAYLRAQDTYINAKEARESQELIFRSRRDRHHGYTLSEDDNATLDHLKNEEKNCLFNRDTAAKKWEQARRVADACESYARDMLGWASERPGTLHGAIAHMMGGVLR